MYYKAHNKQVNQSCLTLIFYFYQKIKVLKNGSGHGLDPQKWARSQINPFLLRIKKIWILSQVNKSRPILPRVANPPAIQSYLIKPHNITI